MWDFDDGPDFDGDGTPDLPGFDLDGDGIPDVPYETPFSVGGGGRVYGYDTDGDGFIDTPDRGSFFGYDFDGDGDIDQNDDYYGFMLLQLERERQALSQARRSWEPDSSAAVDAGSRDVDGYTSVVPRQADTALGVQRVTAASVSRSSPRTSARNAPARPVSAPRQGGLPTWVWLPVIGCLVLMVAALLAVGLVIALVLMGAIPLAAGR